MTSAHPIQEPRGPQRKFGLRAVLTFGVLASVALAFAGCHPASDAAEVAKVPGVSLTITTGHGRRTLLDTDHPRPGNGTALGLLEANAQVTHDARSYFAASVDGLREGDDIHGRPQTWNLILNGTGYGEDAATPQLHRGDHVWWDLHEFTTSPTSDNPSTVGGFPAPLAGMAQGQRLVWLRCAAPAGAACLRVRAKLKSIHAHFADGIDAQRDRRDPAAPIEVIVSPVSQLGLFDTSVNGFLAPPNEPQLLFVRPSKSGAFHTLDAGGTRLGRAVRAGGGFITAYGGSIVRPIWIIAGVDEPGLRRAARAFDEETLHARTAVYVDATGAHPLPEAREDLDAAQ